ncbi:glycosyltransferase family 2 protein [Echinicola vietnamensis]|uniref:Putative glycosyltransferase n=1 Tax=Echinicola vietnamensis (strain DSM 17526 / LMG 23754 / KMM 6221) TaxID=926556 RepID=L0G0K6_ECHVK|nr:glycosyltransferase [Echinicola vietnamensis]AGA78843.1 putative glycosyltransferase [Echinicola vietnamensis DSM 17526]
MIEGKSDKKLAGFVITYNRPHTLLDTIGKVFSQSFPPQKLWIIDNSENEDTYRLLRTVKDDRLVYLKVGYNAGPAGGAKIGLKAVADAGFEWIYWGDDNDPPRFDHAFERLIHLGELMPVKGLLGCVGHWFDVRKGIVKRTSDQSLNGKGHLEVNSIAGGMGFIVHSNVIHKGFTPDDRIFFGFEELEFCLRVAEAGFNIWVDKELFCAMRSKSNRMGMEVKLYKKKDKERLWREYYSLRNLLYIAKRHGYHKMRVRLALKWSVKICYGFKYGLAYGKSNAYFILCAFIDHLKGKMGKVNVK